MKIRLMLLAVLASPGLAQADASLDAVGAVNNEIGLNLISTHMNYSETGNGSVGPAGAELDSEDGHVGGFALDASLMQDILFGRDYVALGYDRVHGSVTYTGATGADPVYGSAVEKSDDTTDNFHLRWGRGFAVRHWLVTPYLELGRHAWDRVVAPGLAIGLTENYTHDYYGIGTMVQVAPVRALVLTLRGLAGRTFDAGMTALGQNLSLGDSALYQIGLHADYAIMPAVHLRAGIDYMQFDYGASPWVTDTLYGGWIAEPDSSTRLTTIDAGVACSF